MTAFTVASPARAKRNVAELMRTREPAGRSGWPLSRNWGRICGATTAACESTVGAVSPRSKRTSCAELNTAAEARPRAGDLEPLDTVISPTVKPAASNTQLAAIKLYFDLLRTAIGPTPHRSRLAPTSRTTLAQHPDKPGSMPTPGLSHRFSPTRRLLVKLCGGCSQTSRTKAALASACPGRPDDARSSARPSVG